MNLFEIRKIKDVPRYALLEINRFINISRYVPQPEYYSRVVKKKIVALANSELRRIATALAKK